MKILLITGSYPFDSEKEDSFIGPELRYLDESDFLSRHDLYILPLKYSGNQSGLSKKIVLNKLFCNFEKKSNIYKFLMVLKNKYFYSELFKRIINFNINTSCFKDLKRIASWSLEYQKCMSGLTKFNFSCNEKYYIYTYWFNGATSAAIDFSKTRSDFNIKVISRAHRFDLYSDRNYQVRRKQDVKKIDLISPVSISGVNEILKNGNYNNVFLSYLGILPYEKMIKKSHKSSTVQLVSCSFMSPVKRVPLLAKAIISFSKKNDFYVEWDHFGGGKEVNIVEDIVANAPDNLMVNLYGDTNNDDVRNRLNKKAYDAFINVSVSEGLPVSLMEAQEAGIPIIATNVGGNREIVLSKDVGVLLSESPNAEEIIKAILSCHENYNSMKNNSIKNWEKNFNALKNHEKFYARVLSLFNDC